MQIKRQRGVIQAHRPRDPQQRTRRSAMRRLVDRFDALMAAVAFAEEGDVETARQIVRDGAKRREAPER